MQEQPKFEQPSVGIDKLAKERNWNPDQKQYVEEIFDRLRAIREKHEGKGWLQIENMDDLQEAKQLIIKLTRIFENTFYNKKQYFEKSLELADLIESDNDIDFLIFQIAQIQAKAKYPGYEQTFNIVYQNIKDTPDVLGDYYQGLITAYLQNNDLQKAQQSYQKLEQIYQGPDQLDDEKFINYYKNKIKALFNIADYQSEHDLEQAEETYQKADQIFDQIDFAKYKGSRQFFVETTADDIMSNYYHRSLIRFYKNKEYDKAEQILQAWKKNKWQYHAALQIQIEQSIKMQEYDKAENIMAEENSFHDREIDRNYIKILQNYAENNGEYVEEYLEDVLEKLHKGESYDLAKGISEIAKFIPDAVKPRLEQEIKQQLEKSKDIKTYIHLALAFYYLGSVESQKYFDKAFSLLENESDENVMLYYRCIVKTNFDKHNFHNFLEDYVYSIINDNTLSDEDKKTPLYFIIGVLIENYDPAFEDIVLLANQEMEDMKYYEEAALNYAELATKKDF